MNHKPTMLTAMAIVAAITVTGIAAMATPALASGHHHHNNGIKVNQTTDQANFCSGQSEVLQRLTAVQQQPTTVCVNDGSNNADVQR